MPHCSLRGVELNLTLVAQTTRQRTATAAKGIKAKKRREIGRGVRKDYSKFNLQHRRTDNGQTDTQRIT
jgi:hypothetical protein